MKKMMLVFVGALILWAGSEGRAEAQAWTCTYNGWWTTTATGNKGAFLWKLRWEPTPRGWRMYGNYRDRYGFSFLDGYCKNHSCRFRQEYKSGEYKGKIYYWYGSYTDRRSGARSTINNFKGTWGYSPAARNDGGRWAARAECIRL